MPGCGILSPQEAPGDGEAPRSHQICQTTHLIPLDPNSMAKPGASGTPSPLLKSTHRSAIHNTKASLGSTLATTYEPLFQTTSQTSQPRSIPKQVRACPGTPGRFSQKVFAKWNLLSVNARPRVKGGHTRSSALLTGNSPVSIRASHLGMQNLTKNLSLRQLHLCWVYCLPSAPRLAGRGKPEGAGFLSPRCHSGPTDTGAWGLEAVWDSRSR